MLEKLQVRGHFTLTVRDKEGKVKSVTKFPNTIMDNGATALLADFFQRTNNFPNFFVGLIDRATFSSISVADTSTSHAGWTEFTSVATLVAIAFNAASARSINGPAAIAITGVGQVCGAFVCSVNPLAGGILFSAGLFTGGDVGVIASDTVTVTYTCTD